MVKKLCSRNQNDFSAEVLAEKMREGSHFSDGMFQRCISQCSISITKYPRELTYVEEMLVFYLRFWCLQAMVHGSITFGL